VVGTRWGSGRIWSQSRFHGWLPERKTIRAQFARRRNGYREILGVSEGAKEDGPSWTAFLRELKQRGLKGVQLFVSDKCLGLVENRAEFYPDAKWQRCVVHFYRNVWTVVPKGKVQEVAAMLKAIHAQEDAEAAKEKARQMVEKLRGMRLAKAAEIVEARIDETLNRPRLRDNGATTAPHRYDSLFLRGYLSA